ncbi:MAG: hypothetical protein EOL90_11890 [Spartobacteria bacterium]|nr:hypothetical protein [Spartobacteria bacterium]
MKYTETTTIRCCRAMPIAEFIQTNELVREQAGAEKPLDWLAGQFLPDAAMNEPYDAWIARQAISILSTTLLRDTVNGSSHIARKVSGVQISLEDRDWLFSALGHHPEVLAVWRTMAMDAIAA